MDSCIFEGKVVHTRAEPIAHSFNYRIFMMFLKLNEIDRIFDRYFLWGTGKYSFARFRRSDHIGPEEIPIDAHIRDLVFKETKKTIKGDIFLLTNLSYFGYCFNPISIYYCYDENEKCKDPERLGDFILDNFYLKKWDFNYDDVNSVFIK